MDLTEGNKANEGSTCGPRRRLVVSFRPGRRRQCKVSFARLRHEMTEAVGMGLGCVAAGLLFCGCQVLTYTSPSGERFTRSSLGANTSIHSLAFEATTNGVRRVELRGYQQDSTQALGVVTDAAVKAAITAVKP